jgi:2-(1,2-epoxy-1,2-dihydrophenyl)acetyl-CoA isomerase
MSRGLRVETADGVHRWTLDRPERRNALDAALVDALLAAAESAAADPVCRVVLLDGTPPVFSQGSDVAAFAGADAAAITAHESRWPALRDGMRGLDVPVLAKIRGGAFGGGLFLALFADYRIAEEHAVFTAPEVTLGWIPPGGIEELVEEIGTGPARQLVLTGERVNAPRALDLGLVHRVVPEERLDAVVEQTIAYLAGLPPAAVASVKRYFRERARLGRTARDELQLQEFAANLDGPEAARSIDRFAAQ